MGWTLCHGLVTHINTASPTTDIGCSGAVLHVRRQKLTNFIWTLCHMGTPPDPLEYAELCSDVQSPVFTGPGSAYHFRTIAVAETYSGVLMTDS